MLKPSFLVDFIGYTSLGGAAALGVAALGTGPALAGTRAPSGSGNALGNRLYDIVKGFSRWPLHRTGSGPEQATLDWFQSELRRRGAVTSRWEYSYPHYEWTAEVRVGGRRTETVSLYYEGVGAVQPGVTTTPALLDTAYRSVHSAVIALIGA